MSIESVLRSYGINQAVDKHENNPISQRAAAIEAMKKHSFGKDVLGESQLMNERQANYLYDRMFDENGNSKYGDAHRATNATPIHRDMNMMKADVQKTHGKAITSPGASSGLGLGWQGNRVATGGQLLVNGVVDGARLMGEGAINSLGLMTRQQTLQFKQGGAFAKAMAIAPAAFSLYNNVSTLLDGGDITDSLAMNLTGAAGMAGFHVGKSVFGAGSSGVAWGLGKLTKSTAAARTGGAGIVSQGASGASKITGGKLRMFAQASGGALGAGLFTAAAAAATYGIKDLTSSESSIAKAATSYSKLSDVGNITQTRDTLTMRQKALQQLSQSALNDRGSLLGNEAAILKNLL
jgi:hypothetical protein